jgi:hypothetical protein
METMLILHCGRGNPRASFLLQERDRGESELMHDDSVADRHVTHIILS